MKEEMNEKQIMDYQLYLERIQLFLKRERENLKNMEELTFFEREEILLIEQIFQGERKKNKNVRYTKLEISTYQSELEQIVNFIIQDDVECVKKEFKLLISEISKLNFSKYELEAVEENTDLLKDYREEICNWSMHDFMNSQKVDNRKILYRKYLKQLDKLENTYSKASKYFGQVTQNSGNLRTAVTKLEKLDDLVEKTIEPSIVNTRAQMGFKGVKNKFVERYLFSEYLEEISELFEKNIENCIEFQKFTSLIGKIEPKLINRSVSDVARKVPNIPEYQEIIQMIDTLNEKMSKKMVTLYPKRKTIMEVDIIKTSLVYFKRPNLKNEKAKRAFVSLHLGLITPRTIINWENSKRAFSEISSKKIKNDLSDVLENVSSRVGALYLCYQLKMTVDETNEFLSNNQFSTKLYVLDIQELIMFSVLNYNRKNTTKKCMSFNDVLKIAQELKNEFLFDSSKKVLKLFPSREYEGSGVMSLAEYYRAILKNTTVEKGIEVLDELQQNLQFEIENKYHLEFTEDYSNICTLIAEELIFHDGVNADLLSPFPHQEWDIDTWKKDLLRWLNDNSLIFSQAYAQRISNIMYLFEKLEQVASDKQRTLAEEFVYRFLFVNSENRLISTNKKKLDLVSLAKQKSPAFITSMEDIKAYWIVEKKVGGTFENYSKKWFENYLDDLLNPQKEISRRLMIQLILICYLEETTVGIINRELKKMHFDQLRPNVPEDLLLILFLELNDENRYPVANEEEMLLRLWLLDDILIKKNKQFKEKIEKKRIMYNAHFLLKI